MQGLPLAQTRKPSAKGNRGEKLEYRNQARTREEGLRLRELEEDVPRADEPEDRTISEVHRIMGCLCALTILGGFLFPPLWILSIVFAVLMCVKPKTKEVK